MTGREQLRIAIAAAGSVLALWIYEYLTNRSFSSLSAALIGLVADVVLVALAAHWILDWPMRFHLFRRLTDPRSSMEGYWLIRVGALPSRRYSIGVIAYNPDAGGYVYSGRGVTDELEVAAYWRSSHLEFDLDQSRVRYLYESCIDLQPERIQGFGYIYFERTPRGGIEAAQGFFVDVEAANGAHHHHYVMERIRPDGEPRTDADLLRLAQAALEVSST